MKPKILICYHTTIDRSRCRKRRLCFLYSLRKVKRSFSLIKRSLKNLTKTGRQITKNNRSSANSSNSSLANKDTEIAIKCDASYESYHCLLAFTFVNFLQIFTSVFGKKVKSFSLLGK